MSYGKKTINILNNLQETLQSKAFKEKYRLNSKSFIRNRVLGFVDMILIQMNRLVLSIGVELERYLDILGSSQSFSKQAFSQGRQKIKPEAFIALNQQFVRDYYAQASYQQYKGQYLLIAVDGSLCQLPESADLAKDFKRWKNQKATGMLMGRSSVMYDVLNKVVIDSVFENCFLQDRSLFPLHQAYISQACLFKEQKLLYILDRGYQGYELLKDIMSSGNCFVLRCTADYCNEVKRFVQNNIDEDKLYLSPKGNTAKDATDTGLHLRIVRILLSSGEYEYLLTNTDFDREELSKLYFMRWGVETFYDFLKGNLQLENFSSKTKEGVRQDFFACILSANLASLLMKEAQQELEVEQAQKKNKHPYQINKNIAIGILRDNLIKLLLQPQKFEEKILALIKKMKKHKTPIIPNRSFKRYKLKRTRRKFHLSKKRAF